MDKIFVKPGYSNCPTFRIEFLRNSALYQFPIFGRFYFSGNFYLAYFFIISDSNVTQTLMPNLKLSSNRSQTLTSDNKLIRVPVISDMKQSKIAVITGRLQPTYLIVDYCFDN